MASKKRTGGESKAPLIVTLVLSLLLNLGLGVGVYMQASEEDANLKKAKEAEKLANLNGQERDQYRFQAHYLRAFLGELKEGEDYQRLRAERSNYVPTPQDPQNASKAKPLQEVATVQQFFAAKNLTWAPQQDRPNFTYEDLLARWSKDYNDLLTKYQEVERQRKEAGEELITVKAHLKQARDNVQTELNKLTNNIKIDNSKQRDEIDRLTVAQKEGSAKYQKDLLAKEKQRADEEKKSREKDKEIRLLNEVVQKQNDQLAQLKASVSDAPKTLRTDYKIVRIDPLGDTVYVNLGYADKVKPELTFGVHGVSLGGAINPKSKATLEIVQVIAAHLSRARLTSVKDEAQNPVMVGDALYNASWNPNLKKHVAIAGIIDLNGDGRDDSEEFRRNLARHDVVVDAWLDLRDFSTKGTGINITTDYLIIGGGLELLGTGTRQRKFFENLDKGMERMKREAKDNGVPVVPLRKYLESIGYNLPPLASDRIRADSFTPGYDPLRR
jgi:hypothetical protein